MGQSYFIWKNRDCRSMGVWLSGPVPIVRPEERVRHVQIPGMEGDLTQLEGENIFNSYIQTATILVKGGYRVREIYNWLKGADFVTFSGEPDRKQPARIIGAITLNKHSFNLDWWTGEVQFYCQPLKQLIQARTTEVTTSGTTVRNTGDVTEKPDWSFYATGSTAEIGAGGRTLTITGLTAGQAYLVCSDIMTVTSADRTINLTGNSSGEWPVLLVGNNTVTGSGWNSLTVWRKERFL